jgi:hypothetical protein
MTAGNHASVAASPVDEAQADTDSGLHAKDAELDSSAVASAIAVAGYATAAFAHPELSKAEWLQALSPYLTLSAALAYKTVNPATIPAHSVINAGTMQPGSTGAIATVDVPTDAGTFRVVLQRQADTTWLVETITATW